MQFVENTFYKLMRHGYVCDGGSDRLINMVSAEQIYPCHTHTVNFYSRFLKDMLLKICIIL